MILLIFAVDGMLNLKFVSLSGAGLGYVPFFPPINVELDDPVPQSANSASDVKLLKLDQLR